MAVYEYTALTMRGQRVRGTLTGASEQAVLAELEARQLTPVALSPAKEKREGTRIPRRRLGEAYGQLGDLLRAGVPLLRALRLLASSKASPALGRVFRGLADEVEKGSDLAGAMAERPASFEPVHVAMVRAGEKGGFLEDVASRLGVLVVKEAELRSKIVVNMIYPGLLACVGVGVAGVIFGYFVPMFRKNFDQIQGGLPGITKAVLAVSDAVTRYGLVTATVLAALGVAAWAGLRRPEVRAWWDGVKLRMPVIGLLLRTLTAARFCQLLGAMLANGVPLISALGIARDGTGSAKLAAAVDEAIEAVRAGRTLSGPLGESGLFEPDIAEMIAVGEQSNSLGDVLGRVGATLEERVDRALGVAVRMIEPLLLMVLAGVVMFVAAGLLIPMVKLSSGVR